MKISNIKQTLTKPKYCYIPKCHARCCLNAPLPSLFLQYTKPEKFTRSIHLTIPAPPNNPYCRDAVIPVTKPIDKLLISKGKTKDGRKIFELDTDKLLKAEDNYCPFLTEYGRCNIYESRPRVCRDFGEEGWFQCDKKINLIELIKFTTQGIYDYIKFISIKFANKIDNAFSIRKIKGS